ncbi:MAG: hypothetical protein IK120_07250, partial [Muribaculaceae bacterium]|nr:hypothetical protein [Muribaculaceae bacterium]
QTVKQAPSGVLTIDARTAKDSIVVDMSKPNRAIKYGTLTKSGNEYKFTQTGSDKLTAITLDGVKVNLDKACAGATISFGDTTLTVTATEDFTVDATTSPLMLSNVEKISLSSGTIQAEQDVPVNAKAYKVTATSGVMTIGINDAGKVLVGALNTGDKFTVNNTTYEMTTAGLYDAANKKIVTAGLSDDMTTFTVDDAATGAVLSVDEKGALDLTKKPNEDGYTALVVGLTDGAADPTKPIATLTYTDSDGYVLDKADSALSELKSVKLGTAIRNFSTAIGTTVDTTAVGTYTVNGKNFAGKTVLSIETAENSATLTGGTVTLNQTEEVATGSGIITATTGTVTVAVSGNTVTIGDLKAGEVFSVGETSYTMTSIGLINSDRVKEIENSVTIADLSNGWQALKQAPSGALTIDTSTGSNLMVVATTGDPTKAVKYGQLTKSGNEYKFTQDGSKLTSITLSGVKATLDKGCSDVTITAGEVTLTAKATKDFTVDAMASTVAINNATAINLASGTIEAAQDVPVTAKTYQVTATSGTMTIGINDAGKVLVGALNTGDKFTVDNTTYEMTAVGLYNAANKQIVKEGVSDDKTTFTIDDAVMGAVLNVDENGELDLTTKLGNDNYTALVVGLTDGEPDPTKPIATLSYTDANGYSLSDGGSGVEELQSVKLGTAVRNFMTTIDTTVTTSTGTYTVNDKPFNAQNALTLETTKEKVTLTGGTVTLNKDSAVTTPSDSITSTAGTITVAVSGNTVTIGALDSKDAFTVDDTTYTMTSIGLMNGDLIKDVNKSVTVSDLSKGWQALKQAPGGALTIDTSTGSNLMVVATT